LPPFHKLAQSPGLARWPAPRCWSHRHPVGHDSLWPLWLCSPDRFGCCTAGTAGVWVNTAAGSTRRKGGHATNLVRKRDGAENGSEHRHEAGVEPEVLLQRADVHTSDHARQELAQLHQRPQRLWWHGQKRHGTSLSHPTTPARTCTKDRVLGPHCVKANSSPVTATVVSAMEIRIHCGNCHTTDTCTKWKATNESQHGASQHVPHAGEYRVGSRRLNQVLYEGGSNKGKAGAQHAEPHLAEGCRLESLAAL